MCVMVERCNESALAALVSQESLKIHLRIHSIQRDRDTATGETG